MLSKVFYAPGDWLAGRTTVRFRRAVGVWLLIAWIVPGLPLWIIWRYEIWFIGFMSIFALWWTGFSTIGTETPVEIEQEVTEIHN